MAMRTLPEMDEFRTFVKEISDAEVSPIVAKRTAERENLIFKTYTGCTKKLNELFGLLHDEVCKSCAETRAGEGCCHYGPCSEETYNNKISEARERILKKAIADGKELASCHHACNYHAFNEGCIIPNLKSPSCASYWCIQMHPELEEKYGIKYDITSVRTDLELILADTRWENGAWKYDGFDPQRVSELKSYIQSMIDSVKKVKSGERK